VVCLEKISGEDGLRSPFPIVFTDDSLRLLGGLLGLSVLVHGFLRLNDLEVDEGFREESDVFEVGRHCWIC
jgi:hypothetical protein